MAKKICAVGCPPANNYYKFPLKEKDCERRKFWLDYFDMEEPNVKEIFACERHFSSYQATPKGIRRDAVPDVPIIYDTPFPPFKRKPKNWRQNVTVVTPRDPEYIIYRKQTGIYAQYNKPCTPAPESTSQMPLIKTVSYSTNTQTNTRLCGLVQISEFVDKYRLNCFYCMETYNLDKWYDFIQHLKQQHYEQEEAFKNFQYLSQEHDYTPIGIPTSKKEIIKKKTHDISNQNLNILNEIPEILALTQNNITIQTLQEVPDIETVIEDLRPQSLPTIATTNENTNNTPTFSITLADKLIKLLDETVLNPNFHNNKKQNMNIVNNNLQNLNNFIETKSCVTTDLTTLPVKILKTKDKPSTVYSLMGGPKFIAKRRNSLMNMNKKRKIFVKKLETQVKDVVGNEASTSAKTGANNDKAKVIKTGENATLYESVYKNMKTKPKIISSGVFYLKDISLTKMQTTSKTALSRCLKRGYSEILEEENEEDYKPFTLESLQAKPTELVFEYTPSDIMIFLLDIIKNYPILWEFHTQPFSESYSKAIEALSQIIKEKWSINLNSIKMVRSINRILKFYRSKRLGDNNNKFLQYYYKCCQFLPESEDNIPQARCYLCFICYKNDIDLRQHLLESHDATQWPYTCRDCKERFKDNDEYELHKHLPHYEEIFTCGICNKKFVRYPLYQRHLELHKRIEITETGKYPCTICNKEFKSRHELHSHKVFHGERKLKCPLCPKLFFKNTALKFHLKRHRQELDVICEICGKGFIHQSYLKSHMAKHTGAKVTCNICHLKLRKCNLSRHLRTVHIACEGTIESTFRAKNHNYKRLLQVTTRSQYTKNSSKVTHRQYICKACNIIFDRLKSLIEHNQQLHPNVKKWSCKLCNNEFKMKCRLKSHLREKHNLHVYQVYKLVDQNEDLEQVLAIKTEELENMSSTLAYSLLGPSGSKNKIEKTGEKTTKTTTTSTVIIKSDPTPEEMSFEEEQMISQTLSQELMKAVDNIMTEEVKVVIDDDEEINDLFKDF